MLLQILINSTDVLIGVLLLIIAVLGCLLYGMVRRYVLLLQQVVETTEGLDRSLQKVVAQYQAIELEIRLLKMNKT